MRWFPVLAATTACLAMAAPAVAAGETRWAVTGLVANGSGEQVAGARVQAFDARHRRLGESVRTNRSGAFVLDAPALESGLSRQLVWITARGGRVNGRRNRVTLRAVVENYRPPRPVAVNYVSTAVAVHYQRARGKDGLRAVERRVRRALRLPSRGHLGSMVHHTTRHFDPARARDHQRALGGLSAWSHHVHGHAAEGRRARHYGRRPIAKASQGGATAFTALSAARDDCDNSGAGNAQQGIGWGLSIARPVVDTQGDQLGVFSPADNYMTGKSNTCKALGLLKEILALLQEMQKQLQDIQARLGDVERKLAQLDQDTWKQFYSNQKSQLNYVITKIQDAYWDYEHYLSISESERAGLLDAYLDQDFWPVVDQAQAFAEALLPSGASHGIGVYEGAWRIARKRDYFVTRGTQDDFAAVRDYWSTLMAHVGILNAEYHRVRAGLSPDAYQRFVDQGGDSRLEQKVDALLVNAGIDPASFETTAGVKPLDHETIAQRIGRIADAAENAPEFTPLHADVVYDPSASYRDWVGTRGPGGAPYSATARGLLWAGHCPGSFSDPYTTEMSGRDTPSSCSAGRWLSMLQPDSVSADSCLSTSVAGIAIDGTHGQAWIPPTNDELNVLMGAAGGRRLDQWMADNSTAFSRWINPDLPIAYFMTGGGENPCPYFRDAKGWSWYTWGSHMTVSLYHLAAGKASDWLCQSGQEVNSRNYACPFHDSNRVAASLVVRYPDADEAFVPHYRDLSLPDRPVRTFPGTRDG